MMMKDPAVMITSNQTSEETDQQATEDDNFRRILKKMTNSSGQYLWKSLKRDDMKKSQLMCNRLFLTSGDTNNSLHSLVTDDCDLVIVLVSALPGYQWKSCSWFRHVQAKLSINNTEDGSMCYLVFKFALGSLSSSSLRRRISQLFCISCINIRIFALSEGIPDINKDIVKSDCQYIVGLPIDALVDAVVSNNELNSSSSTILTSNRLDPQQVAESLNRKKLAWDNQMLRTKEANESKRNEKRLQDQKKKNESCKFLDRFDDYKKKSEDKQERLAEKMMNDEAGLKRVEFEKRQQQLLSVSSIIVTSKDTAKQLALKKSTDDKLLAQREAERDEERAEEDRKNRSKVASDLLKPMVNAWNKERKDNLGCSFVELGTLRECDSVHSKLQNNLTAIREKVAMRPSLMQQQTETYECECAKVSDFDCVMAIDESCE